MDGGELEKEKAQEIKAEVHRGRKRGRRRQRSQMQRKSDSHPSTNDGLHTPARHSLSLSIDTSVNINDAPGSGQTTPIEVAQRGSNGQNPPVRFRPVTYQPPLAASELIMEPIDHALCELSPPTTEENVVGSLAPLSPFQESIPITRIDAQTLDWDAIMDTSMPATATDSFTGDDVFQFEPLDTSCTIMSEFTSTIMLAPEPKLSQTVDTDASNMIEHYVSDVLPNLFPFLGERLQTLLHNTLVASDIPLNAPARISTLALGTILKVSGLERMGLSCDPADKEAAERWRSETIDQIKSAVQFVNGDSLSSSSKDCIGDIALSLLQLNLLHVSIDAYKPKSVTLTSTDPSGFSKSQHPRGFSRGCGG
jgi:hypothetical protein